MPLLLTIDFVLPGVRLDPLLLPSAASLKTFILRHFEFSQASLATLLKVTNNLEKLQYDYDCDLGVLYICRYSCVNDRGELREGLKCVARTMRYLSIGGLQRR